MNAAELAVQNALAAARAADPKKAASTRDPFIPPGRHELILAEISPDFGADESGRPRGKIWVRFVVEESTQSELECPMMLAQCYDTTKVPKFASMASDVDRFMLLLQQVSGLANDLHLGERSKLMRLFVDVIQDRVADQVLRGRQVSCVGSFAKAKDGQSYFASNYGHQSYTEKGKTFERWVNTEFSTKEASAEDTLALREWLDDKFPVRKREERGAAPRDDDAQEQAAAPAPKKGSSVLERLRGAK